jgi:RNA polymerase sigma factor (sigma-70 family)
MNGNDLHTGEIIERCKKGEASAQLMLYKKYSKAMYNIALRFLNNKMDAEDILQESFITAFEKLVELSSHNAFGYWLKRIVINNCITHIRNKRLVFDDIDEHTSLERPDEEEPDFRIDPAIVHNSIKGLPPGGRTIMVLHALEGYKHREIAEMLGISESTCKSQYRRALALLHKDLKQKIYVA